MKSVVWDHASNIKKMEHETASALLKKLNFAIDKREWMAHTDDFFQDTYSRVEDMFGWADFERCKRLVMVGSGPLPATLMHIAKRYPQIDLLGLDIDADALRVAQALVARLEWPIDLREGDGVHHDYGDAQIVYVANLVSPKAVILRRIAQTAAVGTLVVLRDPTAFGRDQAEAGIDDLPPQLHLEGTGPDSHRFLSRHVFLRVRPMAAAV